MENWKKEREELRKELNRILTRFNEIQNGSMLTSAEKDFLRITKNHLKVLLQHWKKQNSDFYNQNVQEKEKEKR